MTFSQRAGTAIVPTLSRIVLALAFISAGADKLFRTDEFSGQELQYLRQVGVTLTAPAAAAPIVTTAWRPPDAWQVDPQDPPPVVGEGAKETAGEQEVDPPPVTTGTTGTTGTTVPPVVPPGDLERVLPAPGDAATEDDAATEEPEVGTEEPVDDGPYVARKWHHVTALCARAELSYAPQLGIAAGITELLGGVFMLVGFMSRLWALALAGVMGMAFWLTSIAGANVLGMSPFEFVLDVDRFHAALAQLALLVLALGVCLTGAGPISADRLLFRRREPVHDHPHGHEDE